MRRCAFFTRKTTIWSRIRFVRRLRWKVEACADGWAGLKSIEGREHYDLLLLDNDLPLVDGLELARRARQSEQHAKTPIVMISAGNIKGEARLAGVNEFLRKPEDTHLIVDTVRRLLHA